ncbi:MAG TPA: glutathione peroxidase [Xanthomonadales bacterium]|nr:glutathione peroxidase [Xanthomonadales bacterium]
MRVHEFAFRSATGSSMPLERWKGQPLLLVNTASECGFTPQYAGLQKLWDEYRRSGLVVIGIPCNDFGGQEPGSNEEITEFCSTRFAVTFPLTEKASIIGPNPHPLFIALREEYTSDILPRWNFHKYLFGGNGELIDHFSSGTEPDEPGFRHTLESNLGAWTI